MKRFPIDSKGYALLEATIFFPIIYLIILCLILLSMYLPERAVLQYATQHAATAIAIEQSDTWVFYDQNNLEYYHETDKDALTNVYAELLGSIFTGREKQEAEQIAINMHSNCLSWKSDSLDVECKILNLIIYKEIQVTATSTFVTPIDLSFVGFPTVIPIVVTSTATVQNGEEFVRNMDIAADLITFFAKKYNVDVSSLTSKIDQARSFLGV